MKTKGYGGHAKARTPSGQANADEPRTDPSVPPPAPVVDPADNATDWSEGEDWFAAFTNAAPPFKVEAAADKEDGLYYEGDYMRFAARSSKAGFLYVFYQSADGSLVCLYPNSAQSREEVAADQTIAIPGAGSTTRFRVKPPLGKEVLKVFVTSQRIDPNRLGVDSLTETSVTEVSPDRLKEVFLVLEREPTTWAEAHVELETREKRGASKPSGQSRETMYASLPGSVF